MYELLKFKIEGATKLSRFHSFVRSSNSEVGKNSVEIKFVRNVILYTFASSNTLKRFGRN